MDDLIDLLNTLNRLKLNISYETLMSCSFYELDYFKHKADRMIDAEIERHEKQMRELEQR